MSVILSIQKKKQNKADFFITCNNNSSGVYFYLNYP